MAKQKKISNKPLTPNAQKVLDLLRQGNHSRGDITATLKIRSEEFDAAISDLGKKGHEVEVVKVLTGKRGRPATLFSLKFASAALPAPMTPAQKAANNLSGAPLMTFTDGEITKVVDGDDQPTAPETEEAEPLVEGQPTEAEEAPPAPAPKKGRKKKDAE